MDLLQCGMQRTVASRSTDMVWLRIWQIKLSGDRYTAITNRATRWATVADVEKLEPFGVPEQLQIARLERGERGHIMLQDGSIIAYVWFRTDPVELGRDLRLRIGARDIWLADAAVLPQYRRQGIYGDLLVPAFTELAAEGFSRVLLAIDRFNRMSNRAHSAYGAQILGSIAGVRVGERVLLHEGVTAESKGQTGSARWRLSPARPAELRLATPMKRP